MAAVVGLDAKVVADIQQFARRDSEKAMARYLESGAAPSASGAGGVGGDGIMTAEELEVRQLKLLSTIDCQKRTLEKLAKSRGVSMEQLQAASEVTVGVGGRGGGEISVGD